MQTQLRAVILKEECQEWEVCRVYSEELHNIPKHCVRLAEIFQLILSGDTNSASSTPARFDVHYISKGYPKEDGVPEFRV